MYKKNPEYHGYTQRVNRKAQGMLITLVYPNCFAFLASVCWFFQKILEKFQVWNNLSVVV